MTYQTKAEWQASPEYKALDWAFDHPGGCPACHQSARRDAWLESQRLQHEAEQQARVAHSQAVNQ
jgi:hypothetical protein